MMVEHAGAKHEYFELFQIYSEFLKHDILV